MQWKDKRVIALILIVLGLGGIFTARHYMKEISGAKKMAHFFTEPFKKKPVGGLAQKGLLREASKYDTKVKVLMYGGVAFLLAGGALFYLAWKKKI